MLVKNTDEGAKRLKTTAQRNEKTIFSGAGLLTSMRLYFPPEAGPLYFLCPIQRV